MFKMFKTLSIRTVLRCRILADESPTSAISLLWSAGHQKKMRAIHATHIHQWLSLPCWLVPCYMRVSRAYMYWIIMLLCAPLPLASCVS